MIVLIVGPFAIIGALFAQCLPSPILYLLFSIGLLLLAAFVAINFFQMQKKLKIREQADAEDINGEVSTSEIGGYNKAIYNMQKSRLNSNWKEKVQFCIVNHKIVDKEHNQYYYAFTLSSIITSLPIISAGSFCTGGEN